MELSRFADKLNKLDGNVYVVEEEARLKDGVYEAPLQHDNVNMVTLNVYTGPKLTGSKVETYALSTPSLTPWKRAIRVYSDAPVVYISYETDGDTVEAEDINQVQEAINGTQEEINAEIRRSIAVEKELADALDAEVQRAAAGEVLLKGEITAHAAAVEGEIQALKAADDSLEGKKADAADVNRELSNRYLKNQVFTKEEVLKKIEELIGSAPDTLDTFKEIADALGNDPSFAATIMSHLSGKVDKAAGMQLSANDYSDNEKNIVADVNAKKHIHSNQSIVDKLTQAMLDNLSSAYAHINDAVKHITAAERTKLSGMEAGAERNVQTDWNNADVSSKAFLKNKPVSLPASDVKAWAKAAAKPSYGWSEITGRPSSFAPAAHAHTKSQITDFPVSFPANGGNAATVGGYTVKTDVPANAKFSDTIYTHPTSGVTAGTYRSVTVNAQGHITSGSAPSTLAGYGITDAMPRGPFTWAQMRGTFLWKNLKGV